MYLIAMGNAMVLPIFTKSLCSFSDTTYGVATIFGSLLSVVAALSAGKIYDKLGIKPMFIAGTGLFAVFSVMGLFLSLDTSILYIAVIFAFQSVAMSTLISSTTAMTLTSKITVHDNKDRYPHNVRLSSGILWGLFLTG